MFMTLDPQLPAWVIPPTEGFTAEDLDRFPDLPPHTELIDGSLVFVSPQARFHQLVIHFLTRKLERAVPDDLEIVAEMTVTLATRQRPEPDVMAVHASACTGFDQTDFSAGDVVLAVEVVSPDSRVRDRLRKPQLYAEAGIKHFWRIENEDGRVVVYTYVLDEVTRTYVPTSVQRGTLKVDAPFPAEIDFAEIEKR